MQPRENNVVTGQPRALPCYKRSHTHIQDFNGDTNQLHNSKKQHRVPAETKTLPKKQELNYDFRPAGEEGEDVHKLVCKKTSPRTGDGTRKRQGGHAGSDSVAGEPRWTPRERGERKPHPPGPSPPWLGGARRPAAERKGQARAWTHAGSVEPARTAWPVPATGGRDKSAGVGGSKR